MSLLRAITGIAVALVCASMPVGAGQQPPQSAPVAPPPTAPTPPAKPPAAAAPTQAAIDRANQILADARTAMGGEKLAAIKTILTTGRTRRVRGDNLVPIEFEIAIELPDKYVRKDEVPAEESEPTSTGFAGAELIQYPPPPQFPGRAGGPGGPPPAGAPATRGAPAAPAPTGDKPAPPASGAQPNPGPAGPVPGAKPSGPTPEMLAAQARNRLNTAKQDFARLSLGLFAASPAYPLTYAFAARAEAPQGTADVLDVKGEGNFAMRLFIHGDTKLPVMVSWQAPPTNVIVTVPGQPGPKTVAPGAVVITAPAPPPDSASQEDKGKYAKEVAALRAKAQATPIEYRLYFADYRDVDGVKLPFRLRRAIGTETTEETTFDRFRLNTKIDPRKFTVPQR
jgi:hypothetical protein